MSQPEETKEEVKTDGNDWRDYLHSLMSCIENNEPSQLEDLLREEHPILPGEKEAYDWLLENLGREPRLKLDESGYHVVPAEKE